MFWKKWHCMSVESVTEEVELLNRKYGVTFFFWADENPAEDQNKWIDVLYALKETNEKNNNKNHHMLNTRVNHIIRDEKYLNLYKKAGIIAVDLGMESALQQRLDSFNKGTTIVQNERCLDLLRQHDIISIVQVLVGTPDETKETLKETAVMFEKWNPDLMHFYYVTPYPWTKYGKSMGDYIIENDLSKWDYRHPVVKTNNISAEDILKMCKWIKLKFNFNPKKTCKSISN